MTFSEATMSSTAFTAQDLQWIEKHSQPLRFKPGDVLFREGDPCSAFVLVREGAVSVQRSSEKGRLIRLYEVDTDRICVLTTSGVIGSQAYAADGIALTPVVAWALPQKQFQQFLRESETFRNVVFSALSQRVTDLILKIDEVKFQPLGQRLAQYLVKNRDTDQQIKATHQEMADSIGAAREAVSRQLKNWEEAGHLRLERGSLSIVNSKFFESQ